MTNQKPWHPFDELETMGIAKDEITSAMDWGYSLWLQEHHESDSKTNRERFCIDLMFNEWKPK